MRGLRVPIMSVLTEPLDNATVNIPTSTCLNVY